MMWADSGAAWLVAFLGDAARDATRRWPPPRLPRETATGRFARHAADRRHLARLDERLLADVGLTRESVVRGLPFRSPAAAGTLPHPKRRARP